MKKVQVFLLTYNRPKYFLVALNSILHQDFEDFHIIISDNSTNDETEKIVKTISNPKLTYLRRNPSIHPIKHFQTVLSEVQSEYFMIFHDDDIMEPNCLTLLSKHLDVNTDAAAVGGNASIFWNNGSVAVGRFIKKTKENITISSPDELAIKYLKFSDIAPFPSYMYRKHLIAGIYLNPEEGGKYCDVSFLMKILKKGKIIWITDRIMRYRKHTDQDSQAPNINDQSLLITFILSNTNILKNSSEVRYFRHKNWAGILKSGFRSSTGFLTKRRTKILLCSIFIFSPFDIFLKLMAWKIWFKVMSFFSKPISK